MASAAPVTRLIRTVDLFALCPTCRSDEHTEVVPAEFGVRWTECGCKARVVVCSACKVMATERCPHGQELRSELGQKASSVSTRGRPTKPVVRDLSESDVRRLLEPPSPRFDPLGLASRRRH